MSVKAVVTVTDKRTVHTDALDILGRVITDEDNIGRDAIHLAVEPVVAGQTLHAGMEVGRRADGTFGYSDITKTLGIVDPFIRDVVKIGQKFLLVIYPRQITTLRHVWEHPEFGADIINPAKEQTAPAPVGITVAQKESKAWIKQFAEDLKKVEFVPEDEGHTFDEIMAIAENYLNTGNYGFVANSDIYDQDWKGLLDAL